MKRALASAHLQMSLQLSIRQYKYSTQIACGTFTWIDGNTYNSNNGNATYTLQSVNGCDSIVTLDLTIYNQALEPMFNQLVIHIPGLMETHIQQVIVVQPIPYKIHKDATVSSLLILILVIQALVQTYSSCGPFTWIDGNTYTSSNNSATYTIQNSELRQYNNTKSYN